MPTYSDVASEIPTRLEQAPTLSTEQLLSIIQEHSSQPLPERSPVLEGGWPEDLSHFPTQVDYAQAFLRDEMESSPREEFLEWAEAAGTDIDAVYDSVKQAVQGPQFGSEAIQSVASSDRLQEWREEMGNVDPNVLHYLDNIRNAQDLLNSIEKGPVDLPSEDQSNVEVLLIGQVSNLYEYLENEASPEVQQKFTEGIALENQLKQLEVSDALDEAPTAIEQLQQLNTDSIDYSVRSLNLSLEIILENQETAGLQHEGFRFYEDEETQMFGIMDDASEQVLYEYDGSNQVTYDIYDYFDGIEEFSITNEQIEQVKTIAVSIEQESQFDQKLSQGDLSESAQTGDISEYSDVREPEGQRLQFGIEEIQSVALSDRLQVWREEIGNADSNVLHYLDNIRNAQDLLNSVEENTVDSSPAAHRDAETLLHGQIYQLSEYLNNESRPEVQLEFEQGIALESQFKELDEANTLDEKQGTKQAQQQDIDHTGLPMKSSVEMILENEERRGLQHEGLSFFGETETQNFGIMDDTSGRIIYEHNGELGSEYYLMTEEHFEKVESIVASIQQESQFDQNLAQGDLIGALDASIEYADESKAIAQEASQSLQENQRKDIEHRSGSAG